jgi:hypothetical protein
MKKLNRKVRNSSMNLKSEDQKQEKEVTESS